MSNANETRLPPGVLTTDQYIKRFEPLMEAWQEAGFLDNPGAWHPKDKLHTDYEKAVMAVILDNARSTVLKQSNVADPIKHRITHSEAAKRNVQAAIKLMESAGDGETPELKEASTPVSTTAITGATNLPTILGYNRKIMPRMFMKNVVTIQPMALPTGRVFVLDRVRHNNGSDDGSVEARAGWSYRSWDATPGEVTSIVKTARFTLYSEDISVTSHKMKTEVGVEVEEDLSRYHGIDAAALVDEIAADEMAMELDERLLQQMWAQAGAGTYSIGLKPSGYTISEWDRRYLEVVERAAENIFTNQRVSPQILILGSDWKVAFSNINNVFSPTPTDPDFKQGQLPWTPDVAKRIGDYTAYRAPKPFPTDQALLVHKGSSWVDSAFFWLPYIPAQPYSVFLDPDKQVRVTSWQSRYATYYVGTKFRGDKQVALLKIDPAITGVSYPANVEYTGNF